MALKEINISELSFMPFEMVGKEWFLVSAGTSSDFNMMTASWGGLGVMWGKNIFTTVIRPMRHTFSYVENNDTFVITFLKPQYREALNICGKLSGRDCDKVAESKLTPVELEGEVSFAEAKMVLVCKKLYRQPLDLSGLSEGEQHWYSETNKPHIAFAGEIIKAYIDEE